MRREGNDRFMTALGDHPASKVAFYNTERVDDLCERKSLSTTKTGTGHTFRVELTELGGTIVAIYPVKPTRVAILPPETATRGSETAISVAITDNTGKALPGLQPMRVDITDPMGSPTEYTGYYCAQNGTLEVPFRLAINDKTGTWKIRVEDLTTGLTAGQTLDVHER